VSWSRFDDLYDDHPKLMAAMHTCPLAAALHAHAITAASRRESDGLVDPFWLLARVPNKRRQDEALATLVRLRLYDVLPAGETLTRADAQGFEATIGPFDEQRYVVHDYLDFNPSSTQLAEKRRKDALRKMAGRRKDSAGSPRGHAVESAGSPSGPRGRGRAGPHPIPVPSQSLRPPQAPPQAGGPQIDPEDASQSKANPRALGSNPRAVGARVMEGAAAERSHDAAERLDEPSSEHSDQWQRLYEALRAVVGGSSWGLYAQHLQLVGVADGELVIGGTTEAVAWSRVRLQAVLPECASSVDVRARLATVDEHEGLLAVTA